jgi:peptide/nickel transport system permease protein
VAAMSISGLFYIIGGQWLISKLWHLVPISGFGFGWDIWRLRCAAGDGRGDRQCRRCHPALPHAVPRRDQQGTMSAPARAKGLSEPRVLFRHVLHNGLIPVLDRHLSWQSRHCSSAASCSSPSSAFRAGSYTIEANSGAGLSRSCAPMVFLGAVLYIIGLIMTDVSYTIADPRVRFS